MESSPYLLSDEESIALETGYRFKNSALIYKGNFHMSVKGSETDVPYFSPEWELLAPVTLQTLCVRHVPEGFEADQLDKHTLGWVETINNSGAAYLTPTQLHGRWAVRISIGAEATTFENVKKLWETMKSAVKR